MEKPVNIPSAADLEAAERRRVQELKDYRKKHPKVWFMK